MRARGAGKPCQRRDVVEPTDQQRGGSELVARVQGVVEAYVWLCSQIGQPINTPLVAAAQVVLQAGVGLLEIRPAVEEIIQQELAGNGEFGERLAGGELSVW